MLRPNYAMDAPPTELTVGGASYAVDVDYRTWIQIADILRDITPDAGGMEALERAETLAFGGVLADEQPAEVLEALCGFLTGYPSAPLNSAPDSGPPTYSFDYDLNEIILAIRNQSGIDLSYRRTEPFHWWLFLLEFHTLCGEHQILHLMDTRGYRGKDKDMLRLKRRYALPVEYTAEEREAMEEFNRQFDGIGE